MDLGVLFDERLNFKLHIDKIHANATRIYVLGRRFAREIGANSIILNIFFVYIRPSLDYCTICWSQKRIMEEREIEKITHAVTRFALKTPFYPSHPNYVSFEERLERLKIITLDERRKIIRMTRVIKILQEQMPCAVANKIRGHLQNRVTNIRNPRLFSIPANLNPSSPSYLLMIEANELIYSGDPSVFYDDLFHFFTEFAKNNS